MLYPLSYERGCLASLRHFMRALCQPEPPTDDGHRLHSGDRASNSSPADARRTLAGRAWRAQAERYPTIEIRIADVCLRADDAVLIAALARALVETEARSWQEGRDALQPRTELLRLAAWRASRSGLDATLLNPVTGLPEQARIVVNMLLDHCREALADAGEADAVAELLTALFARGNGAAFQRASYQKSGRLSDVISSVVNVTEAG
jgi:glutamate---cysteine ligase / carboxylate-amine ligase